jgi:MFS superfamily sulfate permease-like transporter
MSGTKLFVRRKFSSFARGRMTKCVVFVVFVVSVVSVGLVHGVLRRKVRHV